MEKTPTSFRTGVKAAEWSSGRKNPVGVDKEKLLLFRKTHDLIYLDQITLDNVLDCLVERFRSREYHTFAGSVLVSLNPCLKSSRSNFEDMQAKVQYEDVNVVVRSPPHVYSVGQQCLKNLLTVGNHQIIVVSGDSGAGKTTATQQLIKYFIERNGRLVEVKTPNNLDKKIYFATLILEALGNASTTANHNSSRFGRLVQLTLDTDTSSIIGAKIRTCLLEKHRVSKCSSNERNFHIFYHFIIALKNGSVRLQDFADNADPDGTYLISQHFKDSVTPEDEDDFKILYQSLQGLNLSTELDNIFRVVFGIMVLLNVQFIPLEDDGFIEDEDNTMEINRDGCGNVKEFGVYDDKGIVETLGNIFGIDGELLVQSLVSRKIMAGGARRKSIFVRRCETIQECKDRLSAVTSALYDALFNHVLTRLNRMLNFKKGSTTTYDEWDDYASMKSRESSRQLSLLDLYGFENFEKQNHLEQLCINYANERLQHVHVSKMKSYFEEMHEVENFMTEPTELLRVEKEISERIDDLEHTVFSILNEECLLNRGSQIKAVFGRMSITTKSSKYIHVSKFETDCYPFVVKHYASDVQYYLEGMVTKNADYIPPEFYEVFDNSDNHFIKSLISTSKATVNECSNNSNSVKNQNNKRKGRTVLQRFKSSVDELVNELITDESHDIHFIRCIRPNSELTEGKIQHEVVKRQLFSSGIVDIIRIAGNGYPIRISKDKFRQQFSALLRRHCQEDLDENVLKHLLPFDESELKFGKSLVFLSENCWKFMKGLERCVTIGYVLKIQRIWRQCLESKRLENELLNQVKLPDFSSSFSGNEEDCFYSPRAGPFGDMGDQKACEKLEVFHESRQYWETEISNSKNETYSSMEKMQRLLKRKSYEVVKLSLSNICATSIYIGDRIVSRSQIYEPPIKFFTRKTSLTNSHVVPKRLKPKGVPDALLKSGEKGRA